MRRQLSMVYAADAASRQEELDILLAAAPATGWGEAVAKARYLLILFAQTPAAEIRGGPRSSRMFSPTSSGCLQNRNTHPPRVTPKKEKPKLSGDRPGAVRAHRRMSIENPLWGAPKIHGELLKLGIGVAQSTVSIYIVPRQGRPLQTWKIFLRNHVEEIASIDLFVVPAIAFRQLFAFLVLGH